MMVQLRRWMVLLLSAVLLGSMCSCSSGKAEEDSKEAVPDLRTEMREDMTTSEIVADMGIGINLGNTLEACGDWINGDTVNDYETAWGSPTVTEEMIAGYAAAGFRSVRIPVAWSNLMDEDYTIAPELLDRVETVVQYVLDHDMYAIVNLHWDNGWIAGFSTDFDSCMEKYTRIWEQVSEQLADYGDHLILESMNEEGCFDDLWNRYSGSDDGKAEAYGIVNQINQKFVDLMRSAKGNNPKRHLLIAGYATDVDMTCDAAFQMPEDSASRCAVSVHYYTPPTFCILEEDADWGKAKTTWGSPRDYRILEKDMDKLQTRFLDNDIPVIIGEYGCSTKNKTAETIRTFLTAVAQEAYSRGMCPMLWDVTGVFYDRSQCRLKDSQLEQAFREIAAAPRTGHSENVQENSK